MEEALCDLDELVADPRHHSKVALCENGNNNKVRRCHFGTRKSGQNRAKMFLVPAIAL